MGRGCKFPCISVRTCFIQLESKCPVLQYTLYIRRTVIVHVIMDTVATFFSWSSLAMTVEGSAHAKLRIPHKCHWEQMMFSRQPKNTKKHSPLEKTIRSYRSNQPHRCIKYHFLFPGKRALVLTNPEKRGGRSFIRNFLYLFVGLWQYSSLPHSVLWTIFSKLIF